MVQKTVLKVDVSCDKCKKKILKAVSGLPGVEKIEIDGAKGTLSVTGDADPYEVIVRSRKAGKYAEVVSIGPPPAPPKPDGQKKPEEKKPEQKPKPQPQPMAQMYAPPPPIMPPVCAVCQGITPVVHVTRREEPNPQCSIL
ncbi:PREDICTED: heavy metal-associated isoprenylated plant protein 43-like [Nicotiana attenuata]|uniref:heavy metal-associated isoprenylated plant protein 43-like n=1 Tax=Nicotiana attenuata TaxID=49451 RepID=UPI000904A9D9|nr:PREDICTED: heavy metal-associated isoprenylated plant protein 43-like [Nicotiana attenuata]